MTATVHPISERIEEPHFHAARLHALIVSAVCVDDTSLAMEEVEKDDIRSCLNQHGSRGIVPPADQLAPRLAGLIRPCPPYPGAAD
jgi:hypothetical protein